MEIKYLPELVEPKAVEFNFDEIKAELTSQLEKYNNLVITEETIQEAKKTKANLNHFKTIVDEERKRVKRIYEEPYRAIEPKFKELYSLIDEPVMAIDKQIKYFVEIELNKKQAQIFEIYKKHIGNLEAIVPLERIYQSQWNNKTFTLKKIESSIIEIVNGINTDLNVIKDFNSEFETELRTTYLDNFSFSDVILKKRKLEGQKNFIESQKENVSASETIQTETEIKYYTKDFRVTATKSQLIALSEFLQKNNITFGAVPKEENMICA